MDVSQIQTILEREGQSEGKVFRTHFDSLKEIGPNIFLQQKGTVNNGVFEPGFPQIPEVWDENAKVTWKLDKNGKLFWQKFEKPRERARGKIVNGK